MRLEAFFEKFDQFADAPNAVATIRELILWSAFNGAFSAEERSQPMPQDWTVDGTPTLPAIPSSWKWQRGSEVFDVIRGVSYKKHDASESPVQGFFPLLRANNIGKGVNFDGLIYVPRDNIRDEQFVRRGDILIAMSSGSKKLVGKAAPIVTDFIGAFGAFCSIIRNKSAIPDEVLARYFQSPQYTSWVTTAGRGIGINNLGRGDLDSLPVPTPPLSEQNRILAKVDELMALCDRLTLEQQGRETRHAALARASLARFADAPTAANLSFIFHPSYDIPPGDLRKSILTLAVQGKLVSQDANDEPVEKLAARIRGDCQNQKKTAKAVTVQVPEDELPHRLPFGWCWSCVQELAQPDESVTYGILKPVWVESGVPTVRVTEMKSGNIDVGALPKCDPQRAAKFSKTTLNEGDLLITKDGTIGKTAFVPKELIGGNITQHVLRFAISERVDRTFIRLCIDAPPCQAWMVGETKGVALQGVNVGDFRRMPIPLPPLTEQRRIVAKVEQLMALVDELEVRLAESRAVAANLLSALVADLTRSA